jgi:hypothetical protein
LRAWFAEQAGLGQFPGVKGGRRKRRSNQRTG